MAEVLVQFDPPLAAADGRTYVARICGRLADDGLWDGWIEFDPRDGGATLRTPRETKQSDRADLEYWATGLTVSYLEGALERARDPRTPDLRPRAVAAEPAFDGPAPSGAERSGGATPQRVHAVLDPFEVYAQGEHVLRDELGALDEGHLRTIIRAHDLVPGGGTEPHAAQRPALVETIVAAVRARMR
jgi:hypothetical protein